MMFGLVTASCQKWPPVLPSIRLPERKNPQRSQGFARGSVLKPIFTDGSSGVSEGQSDFGDVIHVLAKSTDVTLDYGEAPFSQKYSLKGFASAYKVAKNLCGNEK